VAEGGGRHSVDVIDLSDCESEDELVCLTPREVPVAARTGPPKMFIKPQKFFSNIGLKARRR
jgi:hypothetical protein